MRRCPEECGSLPQFPVNPALFTQVRFECCSLFFRPRTGESIEVVIKCRALPFTANARCLLKQTYHRLADARSAFSGPALDGPADFGWEFPQRHDLHESSPICIIICIIVMHNSIMVVCASRSTVSPPTCLGRGAVRLQFACRALIRPSTTCARPKRLRTEELKDTNQLEFLVGGQLKYPVRRRLVAEGVGFEPTRASRPSGFQDRPDSQVPCTPPR